MTPRVEVMEARPPFPPNPGQPTKAKSDGGTMTITPDERRTIAGQSDNMTTSVAKPTRVDSMGSGAAAKNKPRLFSEYDLPGVRFCNWYQFKNRYPDEDLDNFTVEVLVGPQDLKPDMRLDQSRRVFANRAMSERLSLGFMNDIAPASQLDTTAEWMMHRVRLHSASVLKLLSGFAKSDREWASQPTTFLRPFREFIYYHGQMKLELKYAEEQLVHTMGHHGASSKHKHEEAATTDAKNQDIPENPKPSATAASPERDYEDLLQYITFVETVILPLKAIWNHDSPIPPPTKIRFPDLWYIFQSGDLVYVKDKEHSSNRLELSAFQGVRRITSSYISRDSDDFNESPEDQSTDSFRPYNVSVYYIDFDGRTCQAVYDDLIINPYSGELDIRTLPFYPLRFEHDAAKVINDYVEHGKKFQTLCSAKPHWFHTGWSLNFAAADQNQHRMALRPLRYSREAVVTSHPEHVDSEVIIDFPEALRTHPAWRPNYFTRDHYGTVSPDTTTDLWRITLWKNRGSTNIQSAVSENVVYSDDIETDELNHLVKRDPFLTGDKPMVQAVSDENLALLPRRIFAYALRDRKFIQAHVNSFRKIERRDVGFKNLRINKSHLRLIKSLVKNHFDTKEVEGQEGAEFIGHDFIQGKGRGVVILLHGVPGVGKTATAEAVAQEYSKPLFAITCGDLGTTPEAVSKNLVNIFRLANLWGCVLLLDEADVFLSRREQRGDDLQRNALVSVFLRILEYYNGILFLTTNRPGTLDEAVKSRVHTSFFYPHLDWEQTRDIFKLNLERLNQIEDQRAKAGRERLCVRDKQIMEFAEDHFNSHTENEGRWNGRQIRNAFQIAAALAHHGDDNEDGVQRQLGKLQFQDVADAILNYDRFRAKVLGKFDDEIAKDRMERPDRFHDRVPGPPASLGYVSRGRGGGYAGRGDYAGAGNYSDIGNYARYSEYSQAGRGWPPPHEYIRRGAGSSTYQDSFFRDPRESDRDRPLDAYPRQNLAPVYRPEQEATTQPGGMPHNPPQGSGASFDRHPHGPHETPPRQPQEYR